MTVPNDYPQRAAAARTRELAAAILFDLTAVALLIMVTAVGIHLWPYVFGSSVFLVPLSLVGVPLAICGQKFGYWMEDRRR